MRELERKQPGDLEGLFAEGIGEARVVHRAARHKMGDLTQELCAYKGQAEGLVRRSKTAAGTPGGDDALAARGSRAEFRLAALESLQRNFNDANERYRSLCTWFHEGATRAPRPCDEFFGVWDGFLQAVRLSLDSLYSCRARQQKSVLRSAGRGSHRSSNSAPPVAGRSSNSRLDKAAPHEDPTC